MIELTESRPEVDVQPAEYVRLLGYPRGWVLEDRARELAEWARAWYAAHGRPWIYAHHAGPVEAGEAGVRLGGVPFSSTRLDRARRDAAADEAVFAAVGAGPELEEEARRRWRDGKPDEYFFLEIYGSAVVEHLVMTAGARLCAWADTRGLAVLPHDSPGYPDWTIAEQARLLDAINATRSTAGPLPVEVLESGMLRPKKSLLAVFGLTRLTDRVRRLTDLVPCEACAFQPCQFRRAPYRRAPVPSSPEVPPTTGAPQDDRLASPPLDPQARYSVNHKALRRWANERLSIERRHDGSIGALFRYDGTTCTNLGRPLEFHYHLTLGPARRRLPDPRAALRAGTGRSAATSTCAGI